MRYFRNIILVFNHLLKEQLLVHYIGAETQISIIIAKERKPVANDFVLS